MSGIVPKFWVFTSVFALALSTALAFGPLAQPAQANLPPILEGFTDDERIKDTPEDVASVEDPEKDLFKVRTKSDEKLQARSEVYFLTDKISNCRERSLHIPGLDLSTLSKEKREHIEQSLAAIRARQLAGFLNKRGTSLAILGDNARALSDLDEALDVDSEYAPAYNNRAWLRAQKGELKGALSDVNKALELAPQMAEAFDTRGTINLALKKNTDALADFNSSIACNPKYAEAYFHRSVAYKMMGNQEKSKEDEAKAKELQYPVPGSKQEEKTEIKVDDKPAAAEKSD